MADLLKLPFYDSDMARIRWGDLKLEGAPQWQQYPIILEPLEKVTIQLSGRLVWYHRTWTTSGSCGKTKHHVDHREAGPDEQPCRFVIQDSHSHDFVFEFEKKVGGQQETFKIPEDLEARGQLRLSGVLIESLNGGGGDNSGSYNLQVIVNSEERINRFIESLTDVKEQLEDTNSSITVNHVYDSVLKWFPRRLPLYAHKHEAFLNLLVESAEAILAMKKKSDAWLNLAEWLAEWSVTPSAGGKESFANGWLCRGKVVSRQGNAAAAISYFKTAFESTTEKHVVLYEYAKMLEFSGKLFSDANLNVSTASLFNTMHNVNAHNTEAATNTNIKSKAINIGAYEVYKLALQLSNDAGTETAKLTPEDYIKSYDTHYALARLGFLNHTTESLKQATEHLRICRRLAPFRYFTNPALYSYYTLEMLLYDTLKTQRNPFFHSGDIDGEKPFVGFDSLELMLDIDTEIKPDGAEKSGGDREVVLTKGNSWLAINNHKEDKRHKFISITSDNEVTVDARRHLQELKDNLITEPTFETLRNGGDVNPESTFLNVVFNNSIGETIEKQVVSIQSAFDNNIERQRSEYLFNREPKRFDVLQNPALILTTFLKTCLIEAESSYYDDVFSTDEQSRVRLAKTLFSFEAFKLVKQQPTNDGFSLTFKHKEYTYDCRAKLVKGRLQLKEFQIKKGDTIIAVVTIKFVDDDNKVDCIMLSKCLVNSVSQGEDQKINLDYTPSIGLSDVNTRLELKQPHYQLDFLYADNLIEKVTYTNSVIKLLLESQEIKNTGVSVTLAFCFQSPNGATIKNCMIKERASLQSAYIPFKNNINESAFSKVESEDLIWLFKQPTADHELRHHVLLELGRRLLRDARVREVFDSDEVNFAFIYDVILGQYLTSTQSGNSDPSGLKYQAMAASCLLNLVEITGQLKSKQSLTKEAALKSLLQILSRLKSPDLIDKTALPSVLGAINEFVFTFQKPSLPWLVQAEEQTEMTLEERLTIQWLTLIPSNFDDLEISRQLASPLIASGLSNFALDWLFDDSTGTYLKVRFPIKEWFENEAVPDNASVIAKTSSTLRAYLTSAQMLLNTEDDQQAEAASKLKAKLGLAAKSDHDYAVFKALETFCRCAALNQVKVGGNELNQCLSLMLSLLKSEYEQAKEAAEFVLEMIGSVCGIEANSSPFQTFADLKKKLDEDYLFQLAELNIADIEESVMTALDGLVTSIFSEKSLEKYTRTTPKASKSALVPQQTYLGISPIEYQDISQQQWEFKLHDEPYSDEVTALIALSDRYLARKDMNNARKYLLKARTVMVKLDQESPALISDADAAQLSYWRNRIKVKLTWLDQGKDAYGRFITSAPPRRLSTILNSFANDVQKLKDYAQLRQEEAEKEIKQAQNKLVIKRELKGNEFEEKQARLAVEKNQRSIAFLQKSLSGLAGRRQELDRQTNEALTLYNKGKQRSAAATKSLGNLVAQAVVSGAPIVGAYASTSLSTKTVQNIVIALDAVSKVQNGEDPLKVAVQSFGNDLIDMTFSSVEPETLFGVDITHVIEGGAKELVDTGSLNFDTMAKKTMRQMGEHLFNEHANSLADKLDDYIEQAQVDVKDLKSNWEEIQNDIEINLNNIVPLEKLDDIRQFVDETVLNRKGRKEILQKTVDALSKNTLNEALLALDNNDFPIEKVIDLYRETEDAGGLLNYAKDSLKDQLKELKDDFPVVDAVITEFNKTVTALLMDVDKLEKCVLNEAQNVAYEALNVICEVIRTACEYIDVQTTNIKQIKILRKQCLRLFGGTAGDDSLIKTLKLVPFPRARFNQLTLSQSSVLKFDAALNDDLDYESYLKSLFDTLLAHDLSTPKEMKEAFDILNSALSIFAQEVRFVEETTRSLGQSIPDDIKNVVVKFSDRWSAFLTVDDSSLTGIEKADFEAFQPEFLRRCQNLVMQVLKEGNSVLSEIKSWENVITDPKLIVGEEAASKVLTVLEELIDVPKKQHNGLIQLMLDNLISDEYGKSISTNGVTVKPVDAIAGEAITPYVKLKSGAILLNNADNNDLLALDKPTITEIEEKATEQHKALPKDKNSQDTMKPISPKENLIVGELGEEDKDFIAEALNNPGIQAALSTLSMAYPMAGLAVQGVIAINNWLSGEAERKLGARAIENAQSQMLRLDKEVSETRHQRELVLIEQINARDNVERIRQDRLLLREAEDLNFEVANQSIIMRRYNYRRLWDSLELINYKLYILQKAFEYEYDVPIDRLPERHPEFKSFSSLFEISPGTLAGEFNRSNVLNDMVSALDELSGLRDAIERYEDLTKNPKYRDSVTFSLKHDFPDVWEMFESQHDRLAPLSFRTTLQHFSGVMMHSKSMRHSYKIERVSLKPELNQASIKHFTENTDAIDSTLESARATVAIRSPKAMRKDLDAELKLLQRREFSLVSQDLSRFKTALFHSGIGPQMNEDGKLNILEWGPQVSDSNLEVVDPKSHYNFAEGLTPATNWTLVFDPSSTLTPKHLSDIKLTIQFTYCRHEENARHFHLYLNEGGGISSQEYISNSTDTVENPQQRSTILSKLNAKFRNQRLH